MKKPGRPKAAEPRVAKSVKMHQRYWDEAQRIGGGTFIDGIRRALDAYDGILLNRPVAVPFPHAIAERIISSRDAVTDADAAELVSWMHDVADRCVRQQKMIEELQHVVADG